MSTLRRLALFCLLALLIGPPQNAFGIDVGLKTPVCRFYVAYDGDVTCRVGAEFAVPYIPGAALEIGHDFKIAPNYSYLVFRNRRTRRDDVFRIPQSSRVEVLATDDITIAKGTKIITVSPDPKRKKCFIIEIGEALQQKIDIQLHIDDGAELFRLDLGLLRSYLVVDSEGNIKTTHRIIGDTTWPVDSLEFVAVIRSFGSAGKYDLLHGCKRGIDRPIGHVTDIPNDNGEVERFANVVRRISAQSEGNRLKIAKELSRVEYRRGRHLLFLDNGYIIAHASGKLTSAHLGIDSEIRISKGTDPLTKQLEIVLPDAWGKEGEWYAEMDNDVDLTEFTSAIQSSHPKVTVTDTSRSKFVGWLICFGLPALAVLAVTVGMIAVLVTAARGFIRALKQV